MNINVQDIQLIFIHRGNAFKATHSILVIKYSKNVTKGLSLKGH